MKPTKLKSDTKLLEQEKGTYPYGKNGIWHARLNAVQNEPGFLPSSAVFPYTPIGAIETDTYPVIFCTNNVNSAWGYFDEDKDIYSPIIDDATLSFKFNFNLLRPIKGESRRNYKGDLELTWFEIGTGANPPRWSNATTLGTSLNDFLLFPQSLPPDITVDVVPGGNLGMGAYFVAIKYIKLDGTETRYSTLSSPAIATTETWDTSPGTNTGKGLQININSVDTRFDRLQVAIVQRANGVDTVFELPYTPISGPTAIVRFGGGEQKTTITTDEVLVPAAYYENIQAMTQLEDQLFIGNLTEENTIEWQQYANLVKLRWNSQILTPIHSPDVDSGKLRGWMHEEVGCFYIVLKLVTGSNSRAFLVSGPAPQAGDLAQSVLATQQGLTAAVYQVEDTVRNISGNTGDFGVYINQDEVYPNLPQFDSSGIGGEDLRGKQVRHHKMPSIGWCKENLYAGDADYGRTKLDVLGIDVSNVIIPPNLVGRVAGWELHYAKRDVNQATIAGQSVLLFASEPNNNIVNHVDANNSSTGGNWGSYQRTHGHGGPGDEEALHVVNNRIRFHAFDLLFNKPTISPTHLSLQLTFVQDMNSNSFERNDANEVIIHVDYTNGQGNARSPKRIASADRLKAISDSRYLTNNQISGAYNNLRLEGAYVAKLNNPGNTIMGPTNWSTMRRDYDQGHNDLMGFEQSYLTNLVTLRRNVYMTFFTQDLVRTGYVFPASAQASTRTVFGGDTFLSMYSFNTYGLVTSRDVVDDTGEKDWKTLATDGIKATHQFICETTANLAARYEIAGNNYSKFYPKSNEQSGGFLGDFSRNTEPNQFGYNKEDNSVGDLLNGIRAASPYDIFVQQSPYKIARSSKQIREGRSNSWKNFSALDYYETVKNRGPITNLQGMDDRLIIHHKDGFFVTRDKTVLNGGGTIPLTLGSGDIFQFEPKEPRPSKLGYAGTQHPLACVLTPIGYLFPDARTGEFFLFNGNDLINLGPLGILNFLLKYLTITEDNPFTGNGITVGYDAEYKRVLLTCKNTQLSAVSTNFVPGYEPTAEFFAKLVPNQSIIYKRGKFLLYKGVNTSQFQCPATPVVTVPNKTATVDEHIPNDTVIITNTASGGTGPYIFSIIAGNNLAAVKINPSTGVISVANSNNLDWSIQPLVLTIRATDSNGISGTGTTTINLNRLESTPVIKSQQTSIPETSPNGTDVMQMVATDRDGKPITFAITGGNTDNIFAISASGDITVADRTLLSYDHDNSYTLEITATAGTKHTVGTALIDITKTTVAPQVTNTNLSTPGNASDNTIVGAVTPATGPAIYELVSDDSDIPGAFAIDLDDTSPTFLKVTVLDHTKLDPFHNYSFTLQAYNPTNPSSSSNFHVYVVVTATSTFTLNLNEQNSPNDFVDGNLIIYQDGVEVGRSLYSGAPVIVSLDTTKEWTVTPFFTQPSDASALNYDMSIIKTDQHGVVTTIDNESSVPFTIPSVGTSRTGTVDTYAHYEILLKTHGTNHSGSGYTSVRRGDFQKSNCTGGQNGSIVTYTKFYTSTISQADADNQAATDPNFATEGQANANAPGNGTCTAPLPSDAIGIVVVDLFSTGIQASGYVDVLGTAPNGMPAYIGHNFIPNDGPDPATPGTSPANAWVLASDYIDNGTALRLRWEFNLARLINTYPGMTSFDLVVRGRTVESSPKACSGSYSLKSAPGSMMTMTGAAGSYIPSNSGTPIGSPTNYSGKVVSAGADDTYGPTSGDVILRLRYNNDPTSPGYKSITSI